ncbi:hypothetical protein PM082_016829 [Marasmius tenuissimus]|nr:hypothetical protein PM082_016829 [Marasmius tenuissimus]
MSDVAGWLWAPAEGLYYWSLDPTGDSKIPEAQRIALGIPSFHYNRASRSQIQFTTHWTAIAYDLVRQWQLAKGLNPTMTDLARSMGFPILETLPQGGCFEDCAEYDEDSKTEPEFEQMEAGESFQSNPSSQNASLPHGQYEERTPMDINMEDCIDLVANFYVVASLMDSRSSISAGIPL